MIENEESLAKRWRITGLGNWLIEDHLTTLSCNPCSYESHDTCTEERSRLFGNLCGTKAHCFCFYNNHGNHNFRENIKLFLLEKSED